MDLLDGVVYVGVDDWVYVGVDDWIYVGVDDWLYVGVDDWVDEEVDAAIVTDIGVDLFNCGLIIFELVYRLLLGRSIVNFTFSDMELYGSS